MIFMSAEFTRVLRYLNIVYSSSLCIMGYVGMGREQYRSVQWKWDQANKKA